MQNKFISILFSIALLITAGCGQKNDKPSGKDVEAALSGSLPGYWKVSVNDVRPAGNNGDFRFDGEISASEALFTGYPNAPEGLDLIMERTASGAKVKIYGKVTGFYLEKSWDLKVIEIEPRPEDLGEPKIKFPGVLVAGSEEAKLAIAAQKQIREENDRQQQEEVRKQLAAAQKEKLLRAAEIKKQEEVRQSAILEIVNRTRTSIQPGARYEGLVTFNDSEGSGTRVPTKLRVTKRNGFVVEVEFLNKQGDSKSSTMYNGEFIEEFPRDIAIEDVYPIKLSAAIQNMQNDSFHGHYGDLVLKADAKGQLIGKGKVYHGQFTIKLLPTLQQTSSVPDDTIPVAKTIVNEQTPIQEKTLSVTPPNPPENLDKLNLIDRVRAYASSGQVLKGSMNSVADSFELRSLEITNGVLSAEYYEMHKGGSAIQVSGPLKENGWKFKGVDWIQKAEGAIGTADSFTADLNFDPNKAVLNGKYRAAVFWSGPMVIKLP